LKILPRPASRWKSKLFSLNCVTCNHK
jgi:hypothetical protein